MRGSKLVKIKSQMRQSTGLSRYEKKFKAREWQ